MGLELHRSELGMNDCKSRVNGERLSLRILNPEISPEHVKESVGITVSARGLSFLSCS